MELTNILKRFLVNGAPKMVVKMRKQARLGETLDIMKKADIYVAASLKVDTFNAYRYSIDTKALVAIGIYSKKERQKILADTSLLEKNYKHLLPSLMDYMRKKIISEYVEENPYYRMINGQPPLTDTYEDFIYPDVKLLEDYGFTETFDAADYKNRTPLHLLPKDTLFALDSAGIIDTIQAEHPDKKYISYVATRRVSIVEARRAHNFELLYFPRQDNNSRFYRDFIFYYDEAREYFMSVIFNHNFSAKYEYYDGFIGLMILTMTVQRMISNLFKIVVERDFYDLATLRLFLESFGVPFVELFTARQQRMLVKNLNILLMKKQGTQVMYDILDLLGYDSFTLTKYVLVKQHKMIQENIEADFKPSFAYRISIDEEGNQIMVTDAYANYDFYFVGVDMREDDVRLVDITAENAYDYDEFTKNDPTWIRDEDLAKKLEETDFNFVETKYADMAVNIRMQDKLFEMVYLSRMLLDKKEDTSKIKISLARISENPFSLLEVEVLLICIMCKNNHMAPNILRRPSQVLAVLGFDFKEDLERIKQDILDQNEDWKYHHGEDLLDTKFLEYLRTVTFKTPKDVNDFYVSIRDFEDFMSYAMLTTHSVDAYHAYRKIYNTLMITSITDESYQDDEGNPFFRYDMYLKHLNIELYTFYNNLKKEDCPDYINYIATKFATMFEDTEYMGLLDLGDAALIEGILKIIRTFKSLTIDLKDLDIVFVFDSRTKNTMRLLSEGILDNTIYPKEIPLRYSDWKDFVDAANRISDDMLLQEVQKFRNRIIAKDPMLLYAKMYGNTIDMMFHDGVKQRYADSAEITDVLMHTRDEMKLTDKGCAVFFWDGEPPKLIGGTPM